MSTIEDLQRAFTRVNKGNDILKYDVDWSIMSKIDIKLDKELYTELGVPGIHIANKLYPLVWNCQNSYCIVTS